MKREAIDIIEKIRLDPFIKDPCYLYDNYYSKNEAYQKAMEIKKLYIGETGRFRYFIEEITAFGDLDELFVPGTKFYLWVNKA